MTRKHYFEVKYRVLNRLLIDPRYCYRVRLTYGVKK